MHALFLLLFHACFQSVRTCTPSIDTGSQHLLDVVLLRCSHRAERNESGFLFCALTRRIVQNEEEEPDPVKYHISQLKQLAKQYPASRILWKELFGVLFQQGSGYSVSDVRTSCVDAVRALSKHAERIRITAPSINISESDQGAACSELWEAECYAVEALSRQIEFELCSGHISAALMLLRCVCEWFSCPRESCVSLIHHRQHCKQVWCLELL
jgi:hypothetical protein